MVIRSASPLGDAREAVVARHVSKGEQSAIASSKAKESLKCDQEVKQSKQKCCSSESNRSKAKQTTIKAVEINQSTGLGTPAKQSAIESN